MTIQIQAYRIPSHLNDILEGIVDEHETIKCKIHDIIKGFFHFGVQTVLVIGHQIHHHFPQLSEAANHDILYHILAFSICLD